MSPLTIGENDAADHLTFEPSCKDDPGFHRTAVAFKNKPAPDDPVPAWIFSEPITIIALWLPHRRNMTCRVANFQAGWSPTDSNGTPVPLWPDNSTPWRV